MALAGYKSYIVAGLLALVGIINGLTGDASGWQAVMDNALIILNGLGLATLRAGVAKSK